MTSAERTNDKGTFMVPQTPTREIDLIDLGDEGAEIIGRAKAFTQLCAEGAARVDWKQMADRESDDDDDPDAPAY